MNLYPVQKQTQLYQRFVEIPIFNLLLYKYINVSLKRKKIEILMLLQNLFDPIVTFLAEEHGRSSPGKSADRSQWHHPLPIKEVNQAKGNHRRLANHSRTCSTTVWRLPFDCQTTA